MLERLKSIGLNVGIIGLSIVVFLLTFFGMKWFADAQVPPTIDVLAAATDLEIGDVITAADISQKTVYQDDNLDVYIPIDESSTLIGGSVALPMRAGQPIFRNAVLAPAGEGTRLSAVLARFPDHSLFPLSLEAKNVVAPDIETFLPGDLIGLTVVMGSRPQPQVTPTPQPEIITGLEINEGEIALTLVAQITPTSDVLTEEDEEAQEREAALARGFPPLAKDLFPEGVRVINIQGLPPKPQSSGGSGDGYPSGDQTGYFTTGDQQSEMLILLVPNENRETLSLAIQQSDQVVISLLARGWDETTPGFTYWDFEEMFLSDRQEVLGDGNAEEAPADIPEAAPPVPSPTVPAGAETPAAPAESSDPTATPNP